MKYSMCATTDCSGYSHGFSDYCLKCYSAEDEENKVTAIDGKYKCIALCLLVGLICGFIIGRML